MAHERLHLLLHNHIASRGLAEDKKAAVSQALSTADSEAHLGRFAEAHRALEKAGPDGKAIPAYWIIRANIHGQRGVGTATADLREIEERCVDAKGWDISSLKLLFDFRREVLLSSPSSNPEGDEAEHEPRAEVFAEKIKSELLRDVATAPLDWVKLNALYHYQDHISVKKGRDKETAIHTTKVLIERYANEDRLEEVCLFFLQLSDLYDRKDILGSRPGCLAAIDFCKSVDNHLSRSPKVKNRVLGDLYARLYQLRINSPDGQINFLKAQDCYKECGSIAGLLDIKCLHNFETLASLLSARKIDFGNILDRLDRLFNELQKAQYYRHQPMVLKCKEKLIGLLEPNPTLLSELCYQYADYAEASGGSLNGMSSLVLAQEEVMESDDLKKILEYCQKFKDEAQDAMGTEDTYVYLNVLIIAYRRLGRNDDVIRIGEQFIEFQKSRQIIPDVATLCLTVLQHRLDRLASMKPSDIVDELDKMKAWIGKQIQWFLDKRSPKSASELATSFCIWIFFANLRYSASHDNKPLISSDETCSLIQEQMGKVDLKLAEGHVVALIEGYLAGMEKKYDQCISGLERALPSKIQHMVKPRPNVEATLHYWIGWWQFEKTKTFLQDHLSERDKIHKMLQTTRRHFESAIKLFAELQDVQMVLSCHYEISRTLTTHYMVDPAKVETPQGQEDLKNAYNHLISALELVDAIRESLAGETLDSYMFKSSMSQGSIVTLARIQDVMLTICDPGDFWEWIQKMKARSLGDMLRSAYGRDDGAFERFLDDLDQASAGLPYVDMPLADLAVVGRLRVLEGDMKKARPRQRHRIRQEMYQLRKQCLMQPNLAGFVATGSGSPATLEDMIWISKQAGMRNMVFVDYFEEPSGEIGISYFKVERWGDGGSSAPHASRIGAGVGSVVTSSLSATGGFHYTGYHKPVFTGINRETIMKWKNDYATTSALKDEDALEDLRALHPLIKPLLDETKENTLMVLCPNSRLNGIPIHAIPTSTISGDESPQVLIERNPIVYVPCMSVLRQCVLRAKQCAVRPPAGCSSSTVVGAYDRPGPANDRVYTELNEIAQKLNAQSAIGEGLDKTRFMYKALTTTNTFHFFGHQRNESRPFAERFLQLDGTGPESRLSVRDISKVKFADRASPLVTLIACSSAEAQPLPGDDPLGLVPVMMMSGASSVIGTLWSAHWPSAMEYSQYFYEECKSLDSKMPFIDLAIAHQRAVVKLRNRKEQVYYWGAFVLNGSWFRRAI